MKKSKLSLGLVATFVSAMCMAGCADVTAKDNSLISFKGYDEKEIEIVSEEMFEKYGATAEGITAYYNKILEVLIRNEYSKESHTLEGLSSYKSIVAKAENNVASVKEEAKTNKKANGTTYKAELEKLLDSYGVEDTEELKEYYIYQIEKDEIEDAFLKKFESSLKNEFIGVDNEGNAVVSYEDEAKTTERTISSRLPYHIRHILINIGSGANSYANGTITESEAKKLADVVEMLAKGNAISTFGQIAFEESEDTGTGSKYGDVGIMTNKASADGSLTMVPEFQLGIYAYDSAINPAHTNTTVRNGLGISDEVLSKLTSTAFAPNTDDSGAAVSGTIPGLTEVPYSVFEDLKEYAEVDATKVEISGEEQDYSLKVDSTVYPRNILWNKYLNHHNPFIITNRSRSLSDYTTANETTLNSQKANPNALGSTYDTTSEIFASDAQYCGFRTVKNLKDFQGSSVNANLKALTDETGNIIIGVRSQFGIHLMVIQKSINDFAIETSTDVDSLNEVSLDEYYTTAVPEKLNKDKLDTVEANYKYPHVAVKDGSGKVTDVLDKTTYVNSIVGDASTYSSRASEVKSAIKSYDSTYDYRLYEYLYAENSSSIKISEDLGLDVAKAIGDYFKAQREPNKYNQEEGLSLAWDNYLELIEAQYQARSNSKVMVPEGCIIGFKSNNGMSSSELDALYTTGACAYGK